MVMTRQQLMRALDTTAIEAAIAAAEGQSTAEIRVCVSPFFWGDVRRTAERAFERLGMTNTRERNGVLIFVVPSRRRFVVLGDEAINRRVGQGFWDDLCATMTPAFAEGRYTAGLVAAIEKVGRSLQEHFPTVAGKTNVDELPNEVEFAPTPLRG